MEIQALSPETIQDIQSTPTDFIPADKIDSTFSSTCIGERVSLILPPPSAYPFPLSLPYKTTLDHPLTDLPHRSHLRPARLPHPDHDRRVLRLCIQPPHPDPSYPPSGRVCRDGCLVTTSLPLSTARSSLSPFFTQRFYTLPAQADVDDRTPTGTMAGKPAGTTLIHRTM